MRRRSPILFESLDPRTLLSAAPDLTVGDTGFAAVPVDWASAVRNLPDGSPVPPIPATPGARFRIRPAILSDGQPATGPVPYAIYLSSTPTLSDQSVLIYSGAISKWRNNFGDVWVPWAQGALPPSVTPGTWYPIVIVDPDNLVPESDETNNTLVGPATRVQLPSDDLVPPAPTAPAVCPAGAPLDVTGRPISADRLYPVALAYSLSADDIAGNADDILLGTVTQQPYADWTPDAFTMNGIDLVPGSDRDRFVLPADLPPGGYHLVSTIDPDNAIAEPDETNNTVVGPLITVLPADTVDVSASTSQLPAGAQAAPGAQIQIPVNYPLSRFSQPLTVTTSFVLSTDDILGNADDVHLGSVATPTQRPLPPGVACELHAALPPLDVILPANLPLGRYKLFTVVDPDNQLNDYDRSNNVSAPADLEITDNPTNPLPPPVCIGYPSVPTPVPFPPGGNVTVSPAPAADGPTTSAADQPSIVKTLGRAHVTGGIAAAKTAVRFSNPTNHTLTARYTVTLLLSSDHTRSSNDTPFSTQTITLTLRPHQSLTRRLPYKLPASAPPGVRYVLTTVRPTAATRIKLQSAPAPIALRAGSAGALVQTRPSHTRRQ